MSARFLPLESLVSTSIEIVDQTLFETAAFWWSFGLGYIGSAEPIISLCGFDGRTDTPSYEHLQAAVEETQRRFFWGFPQCRLPDQKIDYRLTVALIWTVPGTSSDKQRKQSHSIALEPGSFREPPTVDKQWYERALPGIMEAIRTDSGWWSG